MNKKQPPVPEFKRIPRHVAIIMDGNGRWAQQQGLPRVEGHKKGGESVENAIEAARRIGVEFLTLYAFSVENWRRPKTEVRALMRLLAQTLKKYQKKLVEENIKIQAIGRLNDLPEAVQEQLSRSIAATSGCTGMTLILALSYSGRVELVEAMKSIYREIHLGHLDIAQLDETIVQHHLYTRYYPDPDLLIRTSGEMRISNFLLWQLSYTEIHITSKLWPDFTEEDFFEAVHDFNSRQRRFGRIS
ncbi:MAG: isoprenyl transferase [Candidatus Methylacidiphilales bacterium]